VFSRGLSSFFRLKTSTAISSPHVVAITFFRCDGRKFLRSFLSRAGLRDSLFPPPFPDSTCGSSEGLQRPPFLFFRSYGGGESSSLPTWAEGLCNAAPLIEVGGAFFLVGLFPSPFLQGQVFKDDLLPLFSCAITNTIPKALFPVYRGNFLFPK